jgi:acyl-CoA thioesterase-1
MHQVPLDQYEKNLAELTARLKTTGAKLIWASTTPVPEGKLDPPRRPEDAPLYNGAAARIMTNNGIAVDDLYGFALPRLKEIQRPENVHFTEAGSAQLAKVVAEAVLKELGR